MASQQPETGAKPGPRIMPPLANVPIRRMIRPLQKFLEIQSVSGIFLLLCTVVALVVANSPWRDVWDSFWHLKIGLAVGTWEIRHSLVHWINDGLMTIFFFIVGLEIKREVVDGELRTVRKAALPVIAAVGWMVVPATIYLMFQLGRAGERGWGIPMATDIAFAIGVLTLLGTRASPGLKIFLLALAIADDIGAILVIACFYSDAVQLAPLLLAGLGVGLVLAMNRLGVRRIAAYTFAGIAVWLAFHYSGVHPTVAGVVLGLLTPGRAWIPAESFVQFVLDVIDRLDGQIDRPKTVGNLTETARETISPLERIETALHPWVAFLIMPIFALANAGVRLQSEAANHPIAWAVAAGLMIGKPLGIFVFSWIAVKCRAAELPSGANWGTLIAVGCLGGIGFTMSLFIAGLALEDRFQDAAKIGTFTGSFVSAILGYSLLRFLSVRQPSANENPDMVNAR